MKETNKGKFEGGSNWYGEWHGTNHHAVTHWVILGVVIIGIFALLSGQIRDWVRSLNEPGITVSVVNKPSAQLSLSPQTQTVKVGDIFTSNIILDTGGKPVDGVDIYALHYDPTIVKVIDDISTQKGIQIEPGDIMNLTAANTVNESSGSIKFGAVTSGGTSFTGKGTLATIHFKALSPGNAYLTFDFRFGSTVDSNAAFKGKDQLSQVVDAIYTVNSK